MRLKVAMKKKVGGIDKIIKKSFIIKLILILLLTSKNAFGTLVIDYEIHHYSNFDSFHYQYIFLQLLLKISQDFLI